MGFLSAEYAITDWLKLSGRGNMDKYTDMIDRQFSGVPAGPQMSEEL
jgi:hypothetical protein